MEWYKLSVESTLKELNTSPNGLSSSDLPGLEQKFGKNKLALKRDPLWKIILEPFANIFVLVLLIAAFISFISHEPLDAIIVLIIVFINAIIFWSQEYVTSKVLRSLKGQDPQLVTVMRDGKHSQVDYSELLPGDIISIDEGVKIPADARLINHSDLIVDESSLTGESRPVSKNESALFNDKPIYEQANILFQGSYVIKGTAEAVIFAIGNETEFGKIAELTTGKQSKSPVQEKIDSLVGIIIKIVGVLASITFVLALIRGIPTDEAVRFVLALSVSAVPEGLPVALTVIIVLGMRRMAKQKALVRSFKAIEDIGLVTAVATDKTGTLTKNKLSVVESWSPNNANLKSYAVKSLGKVETLKDPLDIAIANFTNANNHQFDKYYPFDLSIKLSGVFYQSENIVYIKGAPEHIISNSHVNPSTKKLAESKLHELASHGFRVIGVATLKTKTPPKSLANLNTHLDFVGFLALADELREEAKDSILKARHAGLKVMMITGDHFETAFNIGKQIGIAEHPGQVIQGLDLSKTDSAMAETIKNKTIFARIVPEDKFRILTALKQNEITAMTGDGVNDVPAITNAHVGFAMGSGSDIAKDSSDIILLDDNFATIINTVKEGRTIFDNIQKMLFYLLATSLGEVFVMIGALLMGLPLPLTAIQILWVNIVTDSTMVLPVGLEPAEDNIMDKPPRNPKKPIIENFMIIRMLLVALAMGVVTIFTISILKNNGHDNEYIRSVAFMALIVGQWVNALNARSETSYSFNIRNFKNKALVIGLIISISMQLLVLFTPLKKVFEITEVPATTYLWATLAMSVAILAVSDIHKMFIKQSSKINNFDKLS